MKYWHRKLHLILWLTIIPFLVLSFSLSAYLLQQGEKGPNLQQQELLERIEEDLNSEQESP